MQMRFLVSEQDWARCRFAVSPIQELTNALRLCRRVREGQLPMDRPWVGPVLAAVGPAYRPLLDLLPSQGYGVDFLSPPPPGPHNRFEDELAAVAGTPLEQVRTELARCVGRPSPDPAGTRDRCVDLLNEAWQQVLSPLWPQLRDLLDSDVARRGSQLAAGGLGQVLADLAPQVRLVGSIVLVGTVDTSTAGIELAGRGLLLLPTAWAPPHGLGAMWDPPWDPTLIYPVAGAAAVRPERDDAALAALLGRTRATVLIGLHAPATTTGLASRLAVPLASTSEHLSVLRRAGLVRSVRRGHAVEHRRTVLGDALAAGQDSGAAAGWASS